MIKLNLKTENEEQELIKQYLEENASEILAEKINNGVKIVKDNKTLINKKDLKGFWNFATDEARKLAEQGAKGKAVKDDVVYGWAIHYFEEDSIMGILYNEDGSEYKEKPKYTPNITKTNSTPIKLPEKKENTQASLFDLFSINGTKQEEIINEKELEVATDNEEQVEETGENDEQEKVEIEQPQIRIVENEESKIVVDTKTGEVLTEEQIEKSFDKRTLFILMNCLPNIEMR